MPEKTAEFITAVFFCGSFREREDEDQRQKQIKTSYKFYLLVIFKNPPTHEPFKKCLGEVISEYREQVLNIRGFRETIQAD